MSTIKKITDFEKKGDYLEELLEEIAQDIETLSKFPDAIKINLPRVNAKIELAKQKGLFTKKLENQVNDFRVTMFLRNVSVRVDKLSTDPNLGLLDITELEKEYLYLKDKLENTTEIDEKIYYLKAVVCRSEIYIMIIDIKESNGISGYSSDGVYEKILKAKGKGINVSDLEDLLFDQ